MTFDFGLKNVIQMSGINRPWVPAAWFIEWKDGSFCFAVINGSWRSFANGNF